MGCLKMANEKRLIDANKLLEDANRTTPFLASLGDIVDVEFLVNKQPTVDAVEVTRCEKCKFCRNFYPIKELGKEPIQVWYCDLYRCNRKPDEFCSDGERREGE